MHPSTAGHTEDQPLSADDQQYPPYQLEMRRFIGISVQVALALPISLGEAVNQPLSRVDTARTFNRQVTLLALKRQLQ
jgi:hypothetical protein